MEDITFNDIHKVTLVICLIYLLDVLSIIVCNLGPKWGIWNFYFFCSVHIKCVFQQI